MAGYSGTPLARFPAAVVLAIVVATPAAIAMAQLDAGVGSGDLIRYRTLERADFRNTERPPAAIARNTNYELAATTCVYLRTDRNVSMHIGSIVGPDGKERYEGSLGHLRFEALMDRGCSWWSSRGRDAAYTLQHEQIHFAIREIAARRMNRAAEELMDSLHVTGDSEKEVVEQLKARIEELFEAHNLAAIERNRTFDEDTSWGRNDDRQQEWWLEIERELRETVAWR